MAPEVERAGPTDVDGEGGGDGRRRRKRRRRRGGGRGAKKVARLGEEMPMALEATEAAREKDGRRRR